MSWTEVLGFVTGALSVFLFVHQRVAAWPVGIANSVFWLVLFWQSKLYLDSGLQAIYIVLGVLGWYWWLRGRSAIRELPVTRTTPRTRNVLVAFAVMATAVLWFIQARWTDGSLPFWDASTTVASLVAQYMLVRKLFENWWVWILVDLAYIGMYASQHLYLTAALQPLFIYFCVRGVREWRRSLHVPPSTTPAVVTHP